MTISCDNCVCSKCDLWKSCNDKIYNVENWCDVCNDMDIDRCFTAECDKLRSTSNYSTHPLQILSKGDTV